ncbi:chemotaxis protein CheW [Pseudoalteromonas sp. HM-SA03]|uniref:chemotaxis protein CheW n=1 Tax=Pseudoalteromonas sp. HM-SA03 TaxID=2029678 RepID=UPI000BAE25BB|nr:chemotaxis protein CheW [Pseudoalteromonas sp. HM-SA03]PAY02866.1 chemotaxis protein CheW [Pseudoalteromonas sp. HM-SA03]
MQAITENTQSLQYLTFQSRQDCYAIEILSIKEIIELGSVTKVPLMPEFIKGVINLRGSVVPVIDLSARLCGEVIEVGRRTCIIICEFSISDSLIEMGVIVDGVNEVIEVDAKDLTNSPQFGAQIRADFIASMVRRGDELLIALDLEKVLSVEEMAELIELSERGSHLGESA